MSAKHTKGPSNHKYETNNEPPFSFEEFIFSRYEVLPIERRTTCIICKRTTSSGYTYNGSTIFSHPDCLSLLMFYEFMNNFDISTSQSCALNSNSLVQILDTNRIFRHLESDNNKCYSCAAKNAFFKCSSENCPNYIHLHCAGGGSIVVDANYQYNKRNNYRFLLCQTHLKDDEIDIVKCRFLSKLSLTAEYMNIQHTSSVEQKDITPNTNENLKRREQNATSPGSIQKHCRSSTTKINYNHNLYFQKTEQPFATKKSAYNSFQQAFSGTNTQYMQSINTLVLEYNALRRNTNQKNLRGFEWWYYEILFARIRPDIFEDLLVPENDPLYHLYSDIKGILNFERNSYSLTDLKRIFNGSEIGIQSVINSLLLNVSPKLEISDVSPTEDDDANYTFWGLNSLPNCGDKHSTLSHNSGNITKSGDSNAEMYRPRFALVNLNNRASWISFIFLYNTELMPKPEVVILDYIPLSILEYEYFHRILRSVYYIPREDLLGPTILPLLSSSNVKNNNENVLEFNKNTINLNGYSWELEPPLYSYMKSFNSNSSKSSNILDRKLFGHIELAEICKDGFLNFAKQFSSSCKGVSSDNFVAKQSIALITALKAVDDALDQHKKQLANSIRMENEYYSHCHHNKSLIEKSKEISASMHRWVHFKTVFQQSMDNFISSMYSSLNTDAEIEIPQHDSNIATSKEYCSVCLMPELSHKHMLQQCMRCCVRVHHRCYASYRPLFNPKVTKQEDSLTSWLCEPCEHEIGITSRYDVNHNSAICCVCSSSGGAMKKVGTSFHASNKGHLSSPIWIHLVCAVFLMPNVTCLDWYALSMWDLRDIKYNVVDCCSVCRVSGGYTLKCSDDSCNLKFHPMCAWVGGNYVEYSPFHNTATLSSMLKYDSTWNDVFPAICLRPYCIKHSTEKFNEKVVKEQSLKRSFAYTHYLYHPDPFGKQKIRPRISRLPLEPIYSPVTITKQGAIKSEPRVVPQGPLPIGGKKIGPDGFGYITQPKPRIKLQEVPHPYHSQPTLISIVYGLPRALSGESPRYGINAITTYLGTKEQTNLPASRHNNGNVPSNIRSSCNGPPVMIGQYPKNRNAINQYSHFPKGAYSHPNQKIYNPRYNNIQHKNLNAMPFDPLSAMVSKLIYFYSYIHLEQGKATEYFQTSG
ncbi:conserved hypothetical protein [Theileria equi strain WA]|uniref:Zinc finger PHD-type domain-containing protein n=1 Tax=Theileria equi strain WA TaxID=1537102 RepID=L1LF36_THEEQ|nr:conserved hypothetical protein [Theileria equi strain WA]EKX73758.1 conserved hypothetical protein [Theileria equi strain WA]|eukprot:XP_004833210.1 conserved hypothetical protein [Theileria equi strain WA]